MIVFIIAAMLIALLAVVFALQNTATVTVAFLVWTVPGSQALVLLAALFAGIAICFLALLPSWVRHRWTIRSLSKQVTMLEASLADQQASTTEVKEKLRQQAKATAEAETKATVRAGAQATAQAAADQPVKAAPTLAAGDEQKALPPPTGDSRAPG